MIRTRAQESRAAIEKLYVMMRHLFNRGFYKPFGVSGEALRSALLSLRPEIYGSIADEEKVELNGLAYVIERLPKGIEECRFIKLTSEEGYADSHFETIIPSKRRRRCFRIDKETMYIEVTRGRSEIYDILTHLTFLFIEAEKIRKYALDEKGQVTRQWEKLEEIATGDVTVNAENREKALAYLSGMVGRPFQETQDALGRFEETADDHNGLFRVIYGLGKQAIEEAKGLKLRQVSFTPTLRERIGHHLYGSRWAQHIKYTLQDNNLLDRPIHIISANLHSVMNCLYATPALKGTGDAHKSIQELALMLSKSSSKSKQAKVSDYGLDHGFIPVPDQSGTNIGVQIFDCAQLRWEDMSAEIQQPSLKKSEKAPVLLIMDYAFGEQAFETMDELLKPFKDEGKVVPLDIRSVNIMGKAGILTGGKGDIMIPNAHVFEGTADNYPFENALSKEDFDGEGLDVYAGPMISVLGTSLQNKDVLSYFRHSSWKAIGLEMEGAHYQKAIQAASKIRGTIASDVVLRYAYYASDNPLHTGSTLASGPLGEIGVRPTYLITLKMLNKIFTEV
ncbi:DUF6909 family protein [Persicobacter diffluens]|uniref:Uncharacterized protein n=1 Tax=Persicobacter diffluens TaxID=981 RepID=A0AAN5AMI8_9BACT|nr:hypothetical protein PEDI_44040 [Persicobacter diffluens]